MDWVNNLPMYITAVTAGLGASVFLWKKVIRPTYIVVRTHMNTVHKIDFIFEELKPNGGASIRDAINRIEEGLNAARGMQRALLADHEDALFETDVNGNCIWMNRTYSRLVERTPAELIGHGWQNAIAQEDRKGLVEEWYAAVLEDREFVRDFSFETPSGRKIPVKVRSYKIPNADGVSMGYLGYVKVL